MLTLLLVLLFRDNTLVFVTTGPEVEFETNTKEGEGEGAGEGDGDPDETTVTAGNKSTQLKVCV